MKRFLPMSVLHGRLCKFEFLHLWQLKILWKLPCVARTLVIDIKQLCPDVEQVALTSGHRQCFLKLQLIKTRLESSIRLVNVVILFEKWCTIAIWHAYSLWAFLSLVSETRAHCVLVSDGDLFPDVSDCWNQVATHQAFLLRVCFSSLFCSNSCNSLQGSWACFCAVSWTRWQHLWSLRVKSCAKLLHASLEWAIAHALCYERAIIIIGRVLIVRCFQRVSRCELAAAAVFFWNRNFALKEAILTCTLVWRFGLVLNVLTLILVNDSF